MLCFYKVERHFIVQKMSFTVLKYRFSFLTTFCVSEHWMKHTLLWPFILLDLVFDFELPENYNPHVWQSLVCCSESHLKVRGNQKIQWYSGSDSQIRVCIVIFWWGQTNNNKKSWIRPRNTYYCFITTTAWSVYKTCNSKRGRLQ